MKTFLDVFIQSERIGNKIRLRPLPNQSAPHLFISCSRSDRGKFPAGTIYKADLQLIEKAGQKPFLRIREGGELLRALEYFEHNLELQQKEKEPSKA